MSGGHRGRRELADRTSIYFIGNNVIKVNIMLLAQVSLVSSIHIDAASTLSLSTPSLCRFFTLSDLIWPSSLPGLDVLQLSSSPFFYASMAKCRYVNRTNFVLESKKEDKVAADGGE